MVPASIWWTIRKERNLICYESAEIEYEASQIELYFDCLFGVTSCTHMTVTIFYVLDSLEAGQ